LVVFNLCTELFASCCQFLPVFTGFFHCPGKNTFCHGKNPTLEVSQRQARLVLGWVTVRLQESKPSWYVASQPGQLSLAIPSWVGAMSTGESWDVNRRIFNSLCYVDSRRTDPQNGRIFYKPRLL